jgi:hypothetical protein
MTRLAQSAGWFEHLPQTRRDLPLPKTPNGSPGLATTGMSADTHQSIGFPVSRPVLLEEGRLVVGNAALRRTEISPMNRQSSLHSSYT